MEDLDQGRVRAGVGRAAARRPARARARLGRRGRVPVAPPRRLRGGDRAAAGRRPAVRVLLHARRDPRRRVGAARAAARGRLPRHLPAADAGRAAPQARRRPPARAARARGRRADRVRPTACTARRRASSTTSCCAATTARRRTTSRSSSTTPGRASARSCAATTCSTRRRASCSWRELLGLQPPAYAHVPLVLGARRRAAGQAPRRGHARRARAARRAALDGRDARLEVPRRRRARCSTRFDPAQLPREPIRFAELARATVSNGAWQATSPLPPLLARRWPSPRSCSRSRADPSLNPFDEETVNRASRAAEAAREPRASTGRPARTCRSSSTSSATPTSSRPSQGRADAVRRRRARPRAVDFSRLGKGTVQVSDDRRAVPRRRCRAAPDRPRLDPPARGLRRDRGVLDRLEDAPLRRPRRRPAGDLRARGGRSCAEAAASRPVAARDRPSATRASMLEGMMRGLGFEKVTVRFERPRSERS